MKMIWSGLLLIPLLALSAMGMEELSTFQIPNLINHQDLTEKINAIKEMQKAIDVLKIGLGMDLNEFTIKSSDISLQEKILADLKTMHKNLNNLKISIHIPLKYTENLMTIERDAISKNGMTGIVLEIFVFYRVAAFDLDYLSGMMESMNELTQSIERNDVNRVRRMVEVMPEKDETNQKIFDNMMKLNISASEEEFDHMVSKIRAGSCYFKRKGYSTILQSINRKKMMLSAKIIKFILSLREVIHLCQYSPQVVEEFEQNIPRGLQLLVLDNTENVCIRNSKYQEEIILDKYKFRGSNRRRAFTWTPKTRRDVSKWEVDFNFEFKMRIKNKKHGEYLTTSDKKQNGLAFGIAESDGYDWVIELSTNWDEIYLKNVLTKKYIYVNNKLFCPLRRNVQTTASQVQARDGGLWEFIYCGDENSITPAPE